jgi:hypothetical protein
LISTTLLVLFGSSSLLLGLFLLCQFSFLFKLELLVDLGTTARLIAMLPCSISGQLSSFLGSFLLLLLLVLLFSLDTVGE